MHFFILFLSATGISDKELCKLHLDYVCIQIMFVCQGYAFTEFNTKVPKAILVMSISVFLVKCKGTFVVVFENYGIILFCEFMAKPLSITFSDH